MSDKFKALEPHWPIIRYVVLLLAALVCLRTVVPHLYNGSTIEHILSWVLAIAVVMLVIHATINLITKLNNKE